MNKAFLFDMDGVLVDSERIWASEENDFLVSTLGEQIANKIGSTMGVSIDTVFQKALGFGASIARDSFVKKFDKRATSIYARAALTENTGKLLDFLISEEFKIGVVSASRFEGIERVLKQLPFREKFEVIISINDVPDLRSKPAPDGFLEALRRFGADPKKSIVLEDSNRGIESGKAAGCYVIGYREHLVDGYKQEGADVYADTMEEVIKLVQEFTRR